jgi:hypothetical protein
MKDTLRDLDDDDDIEFAAVKRDDGTPIVRSAARRSFERFKAALAQAGGRPPLGLDGQPMSWNRERGWFTGTDERERHRPRTLADMTARQALVDASIRQGRVDGEMADDRELIAAACPLAWNFARSFAAGAPWPGSDADEVMRIGWRLARRGWTQPADIPAAWKKEFRP